MVGGGVALRRFVVANALFLSSSCRTRPRGGAPPLCSGWVEGTPLERLSLSSRECAQHRRRPCPSSSGLGTLVFLLLNHPVESCGPLCALLGALGGAAVGPLAAGTAPTSWPGAAVWPPEQSGVHSPGRRMTLLLAAATVFSPTSPAAAFICLDRGA